MTEKPAASREDGRALAGWAKSTERGSVLAIRLTVLIVTLAPRRLARYIVRAVAFYYALLGRGARAGIRPYLTRILGRAPTFSDEYGIVARFAQTTLDSFYFASGKIAPFDVSTNGHTHLEELRRTNKGAILLGAHLGSFAAMRAQSSVESLPVYAVVYTQHAQRINDALARLDPGRNATLLQMGNGVDFALRIRELVEKGALVAILADRQPPESDTRLVQATFLGERASFPAGPYLLASILKCPVYLTFGLYREPNRYELYCEPFADVIRLPRESRDQALSEYAQRYAQRLEHYCRLAPDNWFNFYDFWSSER